MTSSKDLFIEEREREYLPAIQTGLSKTQINTLAEKAVTDLLENGFVLQAAEALSAIEEFVKLVKKDVRYLSFVRDELAKNKGKFQTNSGAKIEAAEVGTKYDYSQCNDPILRDLNKTLAETNEAVKEREAFLKAVPEKGIEIRHDDELVTIYPPSKSSTSSYKLTLAK